MQRLQGYVAQSLNLLNECEAQGTQHQWREDSNHQIVKRNALGSRKAPAFVSQIDKSIQLLNQLR